jgi:hypothetical protein
MQVSLDQYRFNGDSWNDALHKALADCPVVDTSGRNTDRPAIGAEILLWGKRDAEPYVFDDFVLPANKLVKFVGPSRGGVLIRSNTGTAFVVDNLAGKLAWSYKGFRGLFFDKCRVRIAPQARGQYNFDECYFDSTLDWAIEGGEGTLGINVTRCVFNRCNGAIGVLGHNADLWQIENSQFLHSAGSHPAVLSQSSGVVVLRNQFENRASRDVKAYVQIAPTSDPKLYGGGWCDVIGNRFGGEPGYRYPGYESFGPPPAMVLLGPDAETVGTMSGVRVSDNRFKAPQGKLESAYYGIVANKAVNQSVFHGNQFLHSYTAAMKYNNDQGLFSVNNMQDNDWSGNIKDSRTNLYPWVAMDRSTGQYSKLDTTKPFQVNP